MRKLMFLAAAALATLAADLATAVADQYVRDYFRRDGTWVQPHYRSNPDGYFWNNYSAWGNVNPYAGKRGYKRPTYGSDWGGLGGSGGLFGHGNSGYDLFRQPRRRGW